MLRLKRRKHPKMGTVREDAPIRSPSHLAWVRGHECAALGLTQVECCGRMEAAHVRTGTDGGTGKKPSDCFSIPLCTSHHLIQHQLGESAFEERYGINMKAIAQSLAQRSPHLRKLRA